MNLTRRNGSIWRFQDSLSDPIQAKPIDMDLFRYHMNPTRRNRSIWRMSTLTLSAWSTRGTPRTSCALRASTSTIGLHSIFSVGVLFIGFISLQVWISLLVQRKPDLVSSICCANFQIGVSFVLSMFQFDKALNLLFIVSLLRLHLDILLMLLPTLLVCVT